AIGADDRQLAFFAEQVNLSVAEDRRAVVFTIGLQPPLLVGFSRFGIDARHDSAILHPEELAPHDDGRGAEGNMLAISPEDVRISDFSCAARFDGDNDVLSNLE